jgi:mannose-1-phosphate guanylyltransferase
MADNGQIVGVPVRGVILAGGQGTRFWPVSRLKRPKQFFSICESGESLIQATAKRIAPLVGTDNLVVVTNIIHRPLVEQHVPDARILCEPFGRNTAASIGLAALFLRRENPKAVMLTVPADHAVSDGDVLRATLKRAVDLASSGEKLVTIGIEPTSPNTGYGYIRCGAELGPRAFTVNRFFEKPSFDRAQQYVASGEYLWNSGMFAWRVDAILNAISEYMPALAEALTRIDATIGTKKEQPTIGEVFEKLESVSIDFGVLEHAKNCAVVRAEPFGWSDVGSWDQWAQHFKPDSSGNLTRGEAIVVDSSGCIVHSEHRMTAVIGAENLIVIDSGDAILVCPRERVQEVKMVVDELKKRGRSDLT